METYMKWVCDLCGSMWLTSDLLRERRNPLLSVKGSETCRLCGSFCSLAHGMMGNLAKRGLYSCGGPMGHCVRCYVIATVGLLLSNLHRDFESCWNSWIEEFRKTLSNGDLNVPEDENGNDLDIAVELTLSRAYDGITRPGTETP